MSSQTPLTPQLYARIGPLLDQALELTQAERAAWLANLHTESPQVRDVLAEILERDRTTGLPLPSGPGKYSLDQVMQSWTSSVVGARIGAWTLDAPIGQGGMGSVWLAHRADGTFDGRAAIKLLHLSTMSALAVERFRIEATSLATLAHANVARLLDAGVADSGQPYLVMEYVEGEPLDAYVQRCQPSVAERIALIAQMLDAISHAHAHLIVHRDLKPSNILVRADGRVTLLDFGIAKQLLDEQASETADVTLAGARALTPLFASPEQLRGDAIGTASDTYSAGVVAYLVLTGMHPTAGENRTTADIYRTTLEVEPGPTRLGDLDTILRKALKKAPAERYLTAAAFNDDLRRFLEHQPVQARPDSVLYRARRFVRRNRAGVAATVLTMLALATITGVAVKQARTAERERDRAVFQSERAEATRQFQTMLLSQIGTTPLTLRQLLDKGVQMFESAQTADPRITSALLLSFADRYGELEFKDEELALLMRADSAAQVSNDVATKRGVACALAHHYAAVNKSDLAHLNLRRAGAGAAAAGVDNEREEATCLLARAVLYDQADLGDSAVLVSRRAIRMLDSAGGANTLQMVGARSTLAGLLSDLNRAREAAAELELQQQALAKMGLGGSLPSTAVLANLSNARLLLGERASMLPLLRDVNLRLTAADPAGGANPVTGFNYAAELFVDEQVDSALVWYRAVAASSRRRNNLPVETRALFGVIRSLSALGRGREAQPILTRYLAMKRELDESPLRDSLILHAFIAAALRDTARAVMDLEQVMAMDSVIAVPPTNRKSWTALRTLTPLLLSQRAPQRAEVYARLMRGIANTDSLTALRSADVGLADLYLARAFEALGQRDSARVRAAAAQVALRAGAGPQHAQTREADVLAARLRE
jgi:eukaryotic-like serine/threonine-protein kinase